MLVSLLRRLRLRLLVRLWLLLLGLSLRRLVRLWLRRLLRHLERSLRGLRRHRALRLARSVQQQGLWFLQLRFQVRLVELHPRQQGDIHKRSQSQS